MAGRSNGGREVIVFQFSSTNSSSREMALAGVRARTSQNQINGSPTKPGVRESYCPAHLNPIQ